MRKLPCGGGNWLAIGSLLAGVLVPFSASALTPKEIYKKAGGAVVLLLGSDDGRAGSGGTGSIVTPDGKVVTNAHVVLNANNQPFKTQYAFLKPDKVTGDNSRDLTRRYKARVLSYSPPDELDLALLSIEAVPVPLPTLAFADPDRVDVGDQVVAIGHPEQGGLWTLTTGAISTVIANYNHVRGKDVFQTEASVNRGNSGGPLLDTDGNMVGINTMIARQAADGVAITAVNFSLKSSVAVSWLATGGMALAYAPTGTSGAVVAMSSPAVRAPNQVAPAPSAGAGPEQPRNEPSSAPVGGMRSPPSPGAQGVAKAPSPVSDGGIVAGTTAGPKTPAAGGASERPQNGGNATAGSPAAASSAPAVVVVKQPPTKPEEVTAVAEMVKQGEQAAPVVRGKPFDPAKAKPKYLTEKHPFDLDDLRRRQMKELEDMMDEMRGAGRRPRQGGDGMGLW